MSRMRGRPHQLRSRRALRAAFRLAFRRASWLGLVAGLALLTPAPSRSASRLPASRLEAPGLEAPQAAPQDAKAQALLVTGHQVFQELVKSPTVAGAAGGAEWRFILLNDRSVNAHSDAKGTVWVGGGLAELLGQDRGLWAAVLSHEIAHCLLRHPSRGLSALHRAFPYVFGKVLRDREHRADAAGMMLMAQAGFHPDWLFVLHHLLRAAHGEQPGAVAFFSSHPRWQTREERLNQVLPEAAAAFLQAWPDAAASPGGPAPLVVFLGKPSVQQGRAEKRWRIRVPLSCRNATRPVTVALKAAGGGSAAKSEDTLLQRSQDCSPEPGTVTELEVRAEQLAGRRKARVEVLDAASALRARSQTFRLRR